MGIRLSAKGDLPGAPYPARPWNHARALAVAGTGCRELPAKVFCVALGVSLPLLRQIVEGKNRRNRANRNTRAAVDALNRIDIQHLFLGECFLVLLRVYAIHRTRIHARRILCADTGFCNHICHNFRFLRNLLTITNTLENLDSIAKAKLMYSGPGATTSARCSSKIREINSTRPLAGSYSTMEPAAALAATVSGDASYDCIQRGRSRVQSSGDGSCSKPRPAKISVKLRMSSSWSKPLEASVSLLSSRQSEPSKRVTLPPAS